mmetsp:Transcript_108974/g.216426  ORF Transcript_108974/g.216426 Transcript_108974/m.216426 type:complete len:244 (-) Transcript_108974:8-739(-)
MQCRWNNSSTAGSAKRLPFGNARKTESFTYSSTLPSTPRAQLTAAFTRSGNLEGAVSVAPSQTSTFAAEPVALAVDEPSLQLDATACPVAAESTRDTVAPTPLPLPLLLLPLRAGSVALPLLGVAVLPSAIAAVLVSAAVVAGSVAAARLWHRSKRQAALATLASHSKSWSSGSLPSPMASKRRRSRSAIDREDSSAKRRSTSHRRAVGSKRSMEDVAAASLGKVLGGLRTCGGGCCSGGIAR